jgi:hypothetical protein
MPCQCCAHVALCRALEKLLSERHGRGMARARLGRSMACVNQTRPHCVNQMEKTQSKPLAARHGTSMCELAFSGHRNAQKSKNGVFRKALRSNSRSCTCFHLKQNVSSLDMVILHLPVLRVTKTAVQMVASVRNILYTLSYVSDDTTVT